MQYKGASRPPCDVLPSLIKLEKARIDKIKRCEDKIPECERHHRRAHGLAFASDVSVRRRWLLSKRLFITGLIMSGLEQSSERETTSSDSFHHA